jgi:hypothetical protein
MAEGSRTAPLWRAVKTPTGCPQMRVFLRAGPGSSTRCSCSGAPRRHVLFEELVGVSNDLGLIADEYACSGIFAGVHARQLGAQPLASRRAMHQRSGLE